jgi:hypothetical protein
MNQYTCIGSLAVETACPKICSSLAPLASPAMAHAARIFRHSKSARVNHQDWSKWAATELCTFPFRSLGTRTLLIIIVSLIGPAFAFSFAHFHGQSGSDFRLKPAISGPVPHCSA